MLPSARTRSRPRAGTPCGYCFQNWATGWDHLIPFSYRADNRRLNLYPSCRRCNSILGNKIFQTIEDKREYVRSRLIEMGKWKIPSGENLPSLPEVIYPKEKMAEVLQQRLPPSGFSTAQGGAGPVREMRERVPRCPPMAEVLQHRMPVRRLPDPPTQPHPENQQWIKIMFSSDRVGYLLWPQDGDPCIFPLSVTITVGVGQATERKVVVLTLPPF